MPTATRPLDLTDVAALTSMYVENRQFLTPWQPLRPDFYFTEAGQREAVGALLAQRETGTAFPLVILDGGGAVVGTLTLSYIIRGAFQSCSVGYWLAERFQGQGLAPGALLEAADIAFGELRLHRVQAETLTHNLPSQRVLQRVGFQQYGEAPSYLHIAGDWQEPSPLPIADPDAGAAGHLPLMAARGRCSSSGTAPCRTAPIRRCVERQAPSEPSAAQPGARPTP